jgi:hypothetical protein
LLSYARTTPWFEHGLSAAAPCRQLRQGETNTHFPREGSGQMPIAGRKVAICDVRFE